MNRKEKTDSSGQSRNIIFLAVGVVVVLALFAGCMLLLARNGLVYFPWLKMTVSEQGTANLSGDTVPTIEPSSTETMNWFRTVDAKNQLKGLTERASYVRTVRIVHYAENDRHTEIVRITRNGERWRAESDERLLISDGENLYVRIGSEEAIFKNESDNLSRELGIAATDALLNDPHKRDMAFSADGKQLTITTEDAEAGLTGEYVIMIESGLVFSEKIQLDGQLIRTVQTDALDVFGADSLDDELFAIPQINGGLYE